MTSDLAAEDVPTLNDDELFERLTALGVSVGPIVESTRAVYRKKLVGLLGGDVIDSPYTDEVDLEDFSGDEEVVITVGRRETRKSAKKASPRKVDSESFSSSPKLRKRLLDDDFDSKYRSGSNYSGDLHTPSPRPSLRTVTGTSSSSSTTTRYSALSGRTASNDNESLDANKVFLRTFVKFILIILFAVAVSFIYQHFNSSSPLEGLEQLARQALDAYEGKTDKGDDKSTPKPLSDKSQPK